jgi:hypothetical protein
MCVKNYYYVLLEYRTLMKNATVFNFVQPLLPDYKIFKKVAENKPENIFTNIFSDFWKEIREKYIYYSIIKICFECIKGASKGVFLKARLELYFK